MTGIRKLMFSTDLGIDIFFIVWKNVDLVRGKVCWVHDLQIN